MAKEKFVRLPDGRELTFPVSMSDAEIQQKALSELFKVPDFKEIPAEKKAPSFFEAFGEGVTTLGDVPEAMRYLFDPRSAEARKQAAETAESPYAYTGVSDIEGPGSLGRFIKEQAGQALGFIAPAAAASITAARVTPGPPIVKGIAGTGAFLTTAGAQYLANTTGRQAAEQEKKIAKGEAPELPDATKIVLTSAAQAGLDIAGFRFFKPLGSLLGLGGREGVKETAEELAKIAAKQGPEKAASILAGTGKGILFEGAQETVQQLLERVGAGLELDSDDAIREYYESALAGGILGGALGGGTTAVQKIGTKTRDELARLAQEARETKDPKVAWKDAKKEILKESEALPLIDEQGNPLPITAKFLQNLGVNPEAKALAGVPMESILNQSATDGGVAQTLVKYFTGKIQEVNNTLERKDLTDERRSELTSIYERLSVGLKTFTQRAQEAEKARKEAEREAQTIPVFKLPEGFEFKKKNENALKGELIDPQGRSRGEFASIEEAGLFANTLYTPPAQPPAATPVAPEAQPPAPAAEAAPAAPTPAPAVEPTPAEVQKAPEITVEDKPTPPPPAAQQAVEKVAEDIKIQDGKANVIDITERLEQKEDAELEAGILETEQQRGQAALTREVNNEIQEALNFAKQAIVENSTVEERGPTFFPEDTAAAQEFAASVDQVYEGLEKGTLPNAVQAIENLRNQANVLKQTFEQRVADREKLEKGVKPELKVVPTLEPTPIPEPAPEVAEQMTYLREELGMDGLASAISSRPAQEQVALTKQVTDTLGQINQLEQNRRTLKNQGDEVSVKAVTEQIRKLENSLDDLEYSLTEMPNTRAAVQEVIQKNGNAAEANKIAADINKENGCK